METKCYSFKLVLIRITLPLKKKNEHIFNEKNSTMYAKGFIYIYVTWSDENIIR